VPLINFTFNTYYTVGGLPQGLPIITIMTNSSGLGSFPLPAEALDADLTICEVNAGGSLLSFTLSNDSSISGIGIPYPYDANGDGLADLCVNFHSEASPIRLAIDNVFNAARRMTGGGKLQELSGGTADIGFLTQGFELHCNALTLPNNLQINWSRGQKFHLSYLTSAACYHDGGLGPRPPEAPFNVFVGLGCGVYNRTIPAAVEFTFIDRGEPGGGKKAKGPDQATITIKTGAQAAACGGSGGDATPLDVSGILDSGNYQAH
jgi:hypothetical protein